MSSELMVLDQLYKEVFSSDGCVKACGREKCSNLIKACQSFDNSIDFGNVETGSMNVCKIRSFCKEMLLVGDDNL